MTTTSESYFSSGSSKIPSFNAFFSVFPDSLDATYERARQAKIYAQKTLDDLLAQAKAYATELNKNKKPGSIQGIYGALDGLVNTYSFTKSWFDLQYCAESQAASFDAMHDWLVTPIGLIASIGGSLIFMVFANIANVSKDNDKEFYKSASANYWKKFREGSQAGRNAFKGLRSTISTANLFTTADIRYLIFPATLFLGSLYVISRLILLKYKDERKRIIKDNNTRFQNLFHINVVKNYPKEEERKAFLEKYANSYVLIDDENPRLIFINKIKSNDDKSKKDAPKFDVEDIACINIDGLREAIYKNHPKSLSALQLNLFLPQGDVQKRIAAANKKHKEAKQEGEWTQTLCLLLKMFAGFIDGLYLFVGILSLVTLSAFAMQIAIACTAVYCLLCIAGRVYEEYELHRDLRVSQQKAEVFAAAYELQNKLLELDNLSRKIAAEKDPAIIARLLNERATLHSALDAQLSEFIMHRDALRRSDKLSPLAIILIGIKHGIAAYGALISAMVSLSTLSLLIGMTIVSPTIVIGCILAGIPIILGHIVCAYFSYRSRLETKESLAQQVQVDSDFLDMLQEIKNGTIVTEQMAAHLDQMFAHEMAYDPIPDSYFSAIYEIFRSLTAGLLKGKKEIEFLFNGLQQQGTNGHYQDTPVMLYLVFIAAIIYACVFAIRAFVKGFSSEDAAPKTSPLPEKKPKEPTPEENNRVAPRHQLSRMSMFNTLTKTATSAPTKKVPLTTPPPRPTRTISSNNSFLSNIDRFFESFRAEKKSSPESHTHTDGKKNNTSAFSKRVGLMSFFLQDHKNNGRTSPVPFFHSSSQNKTPPSTVSNNQSAAEPALTLDISADSNFYYYTF
jgi:hypothetical protein